MRRRWEDSVLRMIWLLVPAFALFLVLQYAVSAPRPATPQAPIPATSLTAVLSRQSTMVTLPTPAASTGQPAPAFTLTGLDGKPHRLADYRGKRIILNFWATWCVPCKIEMPLLEATYNRLGKEGVVVIGINNGESEQSVRDYVNQLKLTFPILLDPDLSAVLGYEVYGLPTTFFIDTKGRVLARRMGLLTSEDLQHYLGHLDKEEPHND